MKCRGCINAGGQEINEMRWWWEEGNRNVLEKRNY